MYVSIIAVSEGEDSINNQRKKYNSLIIASHEFHLLLRFNCNFEKKKLPHSLDKLQYSTALSF